MKKIPFSALAVLLLFQVFLTSCETETTTPDPVDARSNFTGIWTVSENWNKLTYEVSVTIDPGSTNGVFIENFAGSGSGVITNAIVSGNNITINPLPQTLSTGWIIESGSGALQGTTKINWNYVFNDQANTYTAVAVYTKK
jgi:hypothetical protein